MSTVGISSQAPGAATPLDAFRAARPYSGSVAGLHAQAISANMVAAARQHACRSYRESYRTMHAKAKLVVPEVSIYDAWKGDDVTFRNISLDADYARDSAGRVLYFTLEEGRSYLKERGKSIPSLPLLANLYVTLSRLAAQDELATQVFRQLSRAWDRTSTSLSLSGTIVHSDSILGELTYEGLAVPRTGDAIDKLFTQNRRFFQALLGMRDPERLAEAASSAGLVPFYWYPRGERGAMFGGGDFYYMHQYIPGLLMIFCDDEPHPRRTLRGVW